MEGRGNVFERDHQLSDETYLKDAVHGVLRPYAKELDLDFALQRCDSHLNRVLSPVNPDRLPEACISLEEVRQKQSPTVHISSYRAGGEEPPLPSQPTSSNNRSEHRPTDCQCRTFSENASLYRRSVVSAGLFQRTLCLSVFRTLDALLELL